MTALVSERFARRVHALPLRFADDQTLVVAVADPTDVLASDDLQLSLGLSNKEIAAKMHISDHTVK